MTLIQKLIIFTLPLLALPLAAKPLQATPRTTTFVSESGKTTIQISQGDGGEQSGSKIGTYRQIDGSSGFLLSTGQTNPMGFYTQFYDTDGVEQCTGRMFLFFDDSGRQFASRATWQVDGTMPGSTCSTVGQTFELKMQPTRY